MNRRAWRRNRITGVSIDESRITLTRGDQSRLSFPFDQITEIGILVLPTMSVDVDLVSLRLEGGETHEIDDEAEDFNLLLTSLSSHFMIVPEIGHRFPSLGEQDVPVTVFKR